MEPADTDTGETFIRAKRVKHSTACDLCRRKKVSCDAADMPDNRCSRCVASGAECQYKPITGNRRSRSGSDARDRNSCLDLGVVHTIIQDELTHHCRYVEALETRLKRMEELITKLSEPSRKDRDSDSDASQQPISEDSPAFPPTPPQSAPPTVRLPSLHRLTDPNSPGELCPSDDESQSFIKPPHYHGKSSDSHLINAVLGYKSQELADKGKQSTATPFSHLSRPSPLIREHEHMPTPDKTLPPPDLLDKLIDAYFLNFNLYLPLLHRPGFESRIAAHLHHIDNRFNTLVLLVCAIGSIWTKDERIPVSDPGQPPGFSYFKQVALDNWHLLSHPHLYDVQACTLMAAYVDTSESHISSWMMLTLGIRLAMDVGAHRKKTYSSLPVTDRESWRRVFWVLIVLERFTSFSMGRPCAIQDEDFDLDLLTECDDQYWTNSTVLPTSFDQPPGKPSTIAFMNCLVRLTTILAFALRTIYTINKSKLILGFVGAEWRQNIVSELDSALNKWHNSVPAHLHWDPNNPDATLFRLSATLHTVYNLVRINVHRQFLLSPRTAMVASSSLPVCIHAARSIVNIQAVRYDRTGLLDWIFSSQSPLFSAAVVLLTGLWAGRPTGREHEQLTADVEKCLNILGHCVAVDYRARKLRAMLDALISVRSRSQMPSSSDTASDCGPRTVGDLIVVAMENLHISNQLADDKNKGSQGAQPGFKPVPVDPFAKPQRRPSEQESATPTLRFPPPSIAPHNATGYPPWQQDKEVPSGPLPEGFMPGPSTDTEQSRTTPTFFPSVFSPQHAASTFMTEDFAIFHDDFMSSLTSMLGEGTPPQSLSRQPSSDATPQPGETIDFSQFFPGGNNTAGGDPLASWSGFTSAPSAPNPGSIDWDLYLQNGTVMPDASSGQS